MRTFKSYPVKLILSMDQSSSWFLQQNFIVPLSLLVESSLHGVLEEVAVLGTLTLIYIGNLNKRKVFDCPVWSSNMFILFVQRDIVYSLYLNVQYQIFIKKNYHDIWQISTAIRIRSLE